ncbi:pimeloyl-ACP methyl ester carboxylesterase [Arthrobacter sp. SLBN-100]|uniref:alpha/beta fold hydrolase n=1 Tax=Arthrobacter sp. SLBN-100 TaxID=2768450 RepID=UPI00115495AB|nr:alpha/beta fold hydrolase [Arthrobacter sp. SLBN-100]TQJ68336.1 pimeloyl-ACP methyl ester carboxylesterase [Arthrobacter sp. SLBN-100]
MYRTEVSGLSIAYERTGKGPALVLLHGFSLDSRMWRPQLEELSDDFTVFAWDAPGAGRSSDPPGPFGLGDWADCLAGCLRAAGLMRAHILGLSWGGILAQEFYRRHPSFVESLVLADTYAGWKGSLRDPLPQQRLDACLRDASLPPDDFVAKYLPSMFSRSPGRQALEELAGIMRGFHPSGFRLMAKASAVDTREILPTIAVPTLLLWGESDGRSPITVAHQLHEGIAGARLSVIREAGHVSNLENPEAFNTEIRDFCLRIPHS